MNTRKEQTGIQLWQHPDRLADGDLGDLAALLNGRVASSAPKFASWLASWIVAEQDRRTANEGSDEPIEATLPTFNAARWTNSDVAGGLRASLAIVEIFADERRDELREFSLHLHKILAAWAACRLRQCPD